MWLRKFIKILEFGSDFDTWWSEIKFCWINIIIVHFKKCYNLNSYRSLDTNLDKARFWLIKYRMNSAHKIDQQRKAKKSQCLLRQAHQPKISNLLVMTANWSCTLFSLLHSVLDTTFPQHFFSPEWQIAQYLFSHVHLVFW